MFVEIHISIPFADVLARMPLYAKFMKEVLSNRKKFEKVKTITLNEECSSITQRTIPSKLKDPGSFSLPCTIGEVRIKKAVCDLGASVDKFVIPYDFVMLEMTEDVDILIILGRPFLKTAGINTDVKAGKLTLNMGEENFNFDLNQAKKGLSVETECYGMDIREEFVKEVNDHARGVEAKINENFSLVHEFQGVNKVDITVGPL
ncbi:uncharacterized protein LOC141690544 [Apium graveolens]|uniref:uncharacterized protein LOC141690544 n=1 Tax=Apium graveolens TaxID=4045 RepID=UPI003D7A8DFC